MKIVKKWAAGFDYSGKLVVVSHGFRQTKKMLEMQPVIDDRGHQMEIILRYKRTFHREHNTCLFDTPKEALETLFRGQSDVVKAASEKIRIAQERMDAINNFVTSP